MRKIRDFVSRYLRLAIYSGEYIFYFGFLTVVIMIHPKSLSNIDSADLLKSWLKNYAKITLLQNLPFSFPENQNMLPPIFLDYDNSLC